MYEIRLWPYLSQAASGAVGATAFRIWVDQLGLTAYLPTMTRLGYDRVFNLEAISPADAEKLITHAGMKTGHAAAIRAIAHRHTGTDLNKFRGEGGVVSVTGRDGATSNPRITPPVRFASATMAEGSAICLPSCPVRFIANAWRDHPNTFSPIDQIVATQLSGSLHHQCMEGPPQYVQPNRSDCGYPAVRFASSPVGGGSNCTV